MPFQNTGKNICNMIQCQRNTHPLFRTFGLGSEVDGVSGITRSLLSVEVKKWFPRVQVNSVKIVKSDASGEFEYNIDIVEV